MLYAAAHLIRPPKAGHLPRIGEGNVPIPDTCLGNKVEYTKNTPNERKYPNNEQA